MALQIVQFQTLHTQYLLLSWWFQSENISVLTLQIDWVGYQKNANKRRKRQKSNARLFGDSIFVGFSKECSINCLAILP